jgi:hypothetical protein
MSLNPASRVDAPPFKIASKFPDHLSALPPASDRTDADNFTPTSNFLPSSSSVDDNTGLHQYDLSLGLPA